MVNDIEVENIVEISNKNIFYIYTIYINPSDYPNQIIVRKINIQKGKTVITNEIKKFTDLKTCIKYFESYNLTFVDKDIDDPIPVVGSFI